MSAMETYIARLNSFSKAHSTRKRASEAKGAKSSKWPHKSPTPTQLAIAGFYYQPTASRPDNATCFLCQSSLDGWEADDEPIVEHTRLSPDCGWAIAMHIERGIESGKPTEENPMSENMLTARTMTFGAHWPHEDKRGWICKTQKMVYAGWYYCPTPESDDFVKCSYCNLSLDGWEPKDNPYDEHQRRSPDCMFFTLSSSFKSKAERPRKSRASKGSRLSTISNVTAISERQSETKFSMNEGNATLLSPACSIKSATTGKGSKKGGKAKKPVAKLKPEITSAAIAEPTQATSFIEPEDADFEVKVDSFPHKTARGRKRNSDEISVDNSNAQLEDQKVEIADPRPPPAKRRATRSRISVAKSPLQTVFAESHDDDVHMTEAENMPPPIASQSKENAKGSRKRASSAIRKASAMSTASTASLRATRVDDDDIDAALEADLDRPLTDDENKAEQLEIVHPKTRRLTRTKPGSRNATTSVAPVRRTTRTSVMVVDEVPLSNGVFPQPNVRNEDASIEAVTQSSVRGGNVCSTMQNEKTIGKKKTSNKAISQEPSPGHESALAKQHILDQSVHAEEQIPKRPKQLRSRQPSRQVLQRTTRASDLAAALDNVSLSSSVNTSMLDSINAKDDSGHETDQSVASQPHAKPGRKKGRAATTKGRGGKKVPLISRQIEDVIQPSIDDTTSVDEHCTAIDLDDVGLIEPQIMEVEPNKNIKPKQKNAKSVTSKASKPVLNKVVPTRSSIPQAESSRRSSPEHQASEVQHAETGIDKADAAQLSRNGGLAGSTTAASSPERPPTVHTMPKAASPRQSSDAENEPPSSRPSELRPPLAADSPSITKTTRFPLAASTPNASPVKQNPSKLQSSVPWTAIDFEKLFSPAETGKENDASVSDTAINLKRVLPSPEKKMSVEEWILFNAKKREEKLRNDCERLVGRFEGEGVRASKTLEGIACVD